MRMNAEPERDDALLDAALRDDSWEAASAAFKADALRTFGVRQRARALTRWAGLVAASAAVVAGTMLWLGPRATVRPPAMVAHVQPLKAHDQPGRLTDAELIAAFPRGTCFIAEVDGKKQLIFLDPAVERTYVGQPGLRGN